MTNQSYVYRIEGMIPDMVLLLVAAVAIGSFTLSYNSLVMAAIAAGIPTFLTPAFPLTVDSFLLIGTLTVLRANLRSEPTHTGWLVLIVFTIISVILNVSVGKSDWLSMTCHALPPAALAVSLELFTGFIRSDLMRSPVREDDPDVIPLHSAETSETDGEQSKTPLRRSKEVSDHEIITMYKAEPEISVNKAAQTLKMSKSVLYRRTIKLREQGKIPRVGIGDYLHTDTIDPIPEQVVPS